MVDTTLKAVIEDLQQSSITASFQQFKWMLAYKKVVIFRPKPRPIMVCAWVLFGVLCDPMDLSQNNRMNKGL